jgi:2-C-methyl-D-erythritol 2,4-cyclodiphosphate synthase
MHFPDTDPQWKDADSLQFLAHAAAMVRECGFAISYIDSTVILQQPKLKDFRHAIRESIARTLHLEIEQVSVKFKTAEGIGPVGLSLSAEAQAIATLAR